MKNGQEQSGFTLIEVVVASAVSVLIFIAVGVLSDTAHSSLDFLGRTHSVDRDLKRSLASISKDLKRASVAGIVVDTSDPDHDLLQLQVPATDARFRSFEIEDEQKTDLEIHGVGSYTHHRSRRGLVVIG